MVHGTKEFMAGAADLRRRWLIVPWWISSDSRFTLNERLLLSLLLDHGVESAVPRLMTDKYLAERFGWSAATINRTLKSLLAKHLIRISYLRREGLRSTLRMVQLNVHQMNKIKAAFEGDKPDRFWRWDYELVANTDLNTREIAAYGIIRAFAECDQILTRLHLRTLAGISRDSEDRIVRKLKQLGVIDVEYTMNKNRTTRKFTVNPAGFNVLKKPESPLTFAKTGTEAPVHPSINRARNPVSPSHKPVPYTLSNTNRLSKSINDAPKGRCGGVGGGSSEDSPVKKVKEPVRATELASVEPQKTSTIKTTSSASERGREPARATERVLVASQSDPFMTVRKTTCAPSSNSKEKKVVDEDVVRGRDLFQTVKKFKRRPTNTKPSTLAGGFTALREIDGIDSKDIDAVLVWYRDHFDDKYTPKVYGSEGFREKWNQLWDAYQKTIDEVPPLDQYPEIRKVIETFVSRNAIPPNIQNRFPSFCFKSIRNQTEWRIAVQKHYRNFPEKYYITATVGSKYLAIKNANPLFMPDYFHDVISRYAKFSVFTGDVSKQAWTPDCPYEIDRLVQAGVLTDKTIDSYRNYVKEVRNAD